jgi:hypothetical protein
VKIGIGKYKYYFILGGILVGSSVILHVIHWVIFRDVHHILLYFLGDLAFLPLNVFLVLVLIERLLRRREKQQVRQKLNMVVGAFFSEAGNRLLSDLLPAFPYRDTICQRLSVAPGWKHADFARAFDYCGSLEAEVDYRRLDFPRLKAFLAAKRTFLLALLENPNLLEHERFTDMLWAVFHLAEELEARDDFNKLPESDLRHLASDVQRAFTFVSREWVLYAEHLKANYPFLFSLVARTHPFRDKAEPVVR